MGKLDELVEELIQKYGRLPQDQIDGLKNLGEKEYSDLIKRNYPEEEAIEIAKCIIEGTYECLYEQLKTID